MAQLSTEGKEEEEEEEEALDDLLCSTLFRLRLLCSSSFVYW